MRRITTWLLSTISAVVLLFSYHTSTNATAATTVIAQGADGTASAGSADSGSTSSGATGTGSSSGSTGKGSSSSSASSSSSSGSTSSAAAKSYTGDAVSTRYGDVQVEVTVKNGKITAAKVLQVPWSNGRDQQINGYAVPVLNKETVAGQSSSIDMVSGATYTSEGYIQSLQSAIDQANL